MKQLRISDCGFQILKNYTLQPGTRNWLGMGLAAILGIAIWPGQPGAQPGDQSKIRNPQSAVVLQGGTLFDGTGAPPLGDAVVVIRGDRIVAVGRCSQIPVPAGAEALRLDDVGRIRPGNVADIVVVAGDPLTNIRDTRKIELVIREGMVLNRAQVANRLQALRE